MSIEDTSARDPLLHMIGGLGGTSDYITGMEAAGQRQLVASTKLPTDGSDALKGLGFVLGDVDQGDPLFREVTLPEGWSKVGSDHAMHSYVVDQHGRRRVNIFYKAAFYDRRASCTVLGVHYYLGHATYEGEPVVLDDQWCSTDEVKAVLAALIEQAERMAAGRFNEDGVYTRQVERLRELGVRVVSAGGASS